MAHCTEQVPSRDSGVDNLTHPTKDSSGIKSEFVEAHDSENIAQGQLSVGSLDIKLEIVKEEEEFVENDQTQENNEDIKEEKYGETEHHKTTSNHFKPMTADNGHNNIFEKNFSVIPSQYLMKKEECDMKSPFWNPVVLLSRINVFSGFICSNMLGLKDSVQCKAKPSLSGSLYDSAGHKIYFMPSIRNDCIHKKKVALMKTNQIKTKKILTCDVCHYQTARNCDLTKHMRSHTGEKPFLCNFCEYRSATGYNLKTHIRQKHTKERNYTCGICPFKCQFKSLLTTHMRKHTKEKPFACNFCEYKSGFRSNLKIHIQRKHTVKNYECDFCPYKTVHNYALITHIRTHTGEKPFACDFCEYSTTGRQSLRAHIHSKHMKGKNYVCTLCSYESEQKADVVTHLKIHSEEKPFACEFCEYSSGDRVHIKKHVQHEHMKDKHYLCNICPYKSVHKSAILKHILTHTGEKPLSCNFCDYKTAVRYHLKRHIVYKHTKEKTMNVTFAHIRLD